MALNIEVATVQGHVFLRNGFHADGEVKLLRAQIGANLECDGGTFNKPGGDALNAENANAKGSVFLRDKFRADGEVRLPSAQVGGDLDCEGGTFHNPRGLALNIEVATVQGHVLLRHGFRADGEVKLLGVQIGANLECEGGTFNRPGGYALNAENANAKGSVFLRDKFQADGEVTLFGAQIGGSLDCIRGRFNNAQGSALTADNANVKGSVFLTNEFHAEGEVRLADAQIGATLNCAGGTFNRPGGNAISADTTNVRGSAFLRDGFHAEGEVNLVGAQIGVNLECSRGTFNNANGFALVASGIRVTGNVLLNDSFNAKGTVHLGDAHVEGELNCVQATLKDATLDLTAASASGLRDDPNSWPQPGHLILDGFVYERIKDSPRTAEDRLKWLALQPERPFATQPYLQLAKILKAAGDDDGATQVLVAMEDRRRTADNKQPFLDPVQRWPLKYTVGYGYRPLWAFWEVLGLTALGWVLYRRSYLAGGMVPKDKDACKDFKDGKRVPSHYEGFSPLVYSVENSLPLVKLGQFDKWQPDPEPGGSQARKWVKSTCRDKLWPRGFRWLERLLVFVGLLAPLDLDKPPSRLSRFGTAPRFLRWFLWVQILLGWLLATYFLAGVTGIVRKG